MNKSFSDCSESIKTHSSRFTMVSDKLMKSQKNLVDTVSFGLRVLYLFDPEKAENLVKTCNDALEKHSDNVNELIECVDSFTEDIMDLSRLVMAEMMDKVVRDVEPD